MSETPDRTRSRLVRVAAATAVALCGGAFGDDADAVVRTVLDEHLREQPTRVIGWDDRGVVFVDEAGIERRRARVGIIAVLSGPGARTGAWSMPDADALAGGTPVVVETVDGQRRFGSLGPWDSTEITAAAAALSDADSLGLLPLDGDPEAVPLERIGRVLVDPWARPGSPGSEQTEAWSPGVEDELILANGDRVTGFLVELGETLRFDAGGGERAFPIERVAEVRLGNPLEAPGAPRVWLANGEIRDGDGTMGVADGFVSARGVASAWLSGDRLIPLADLGIVAFEPIAGRRWSRRPMLGSPWSSSLGAADLSFDGPARVSWALPPGARAISLVAHLGGSLDDPEGAPGRWADAELVIRLERGASVETLSAVRLDRETARAPIAVELTGVGDPRRVLIVEVRPGRYGPIQDRVLLRRPFLISD
jgi:hypothetical protein